jgi:hypothetical protein
LIPLCSSSLPPDAPEEAELAAAGTTAARSESLSLLYFLWDTGRTERFALDIVNFFDLVEFVDAASPGRPSIPPMIPRRPGHVLVLAHGWSPIVGPNYPLIRTLEAVAGNAGWEVKTPSFLESYRMGSIRGRAERVVTIYQQLLCLNERPTRTVLAGHSQGGAAVALACKPDVVQACHIVGLLLIGAESPLEMDGMAWTPRVPLTEIIHAADDGVISLNMIRQVAQRWQVPLTVLDSKVPKFAEHYNQDDIAHDFLSKCLIEPLVTHFLSFLQRCETLPLSPSSSD